MAFRPRSGRAPRPAPARTLAKAVDQSTFKRDVVERSRELPVVVDFWAEWCGPCQTLGPAIEQAVALLDGRVELVRVNVDANQKLAAAFRVAGIPTVKAFVGGEVVDGFTGASSPTRIEAFLFRLVAGALDSRDK